MVLSRLVQAVPSLLGVTLIAFVLLQLSGDVTQLLLPMEASEEVRADFRRAYGLDRPIPVQYAHYLARLLQGDFGQSFSYRRPALEVVLERLPATLELSAAALLIAVLIAVPAGIISAVKRNSIFDHLSMGLVLLGQSVPTFWLGMLMILVFAVGLHALPVSGRGSFAQLVLPIVTVVGLQIGGLLGGAVMTEAVFAWPGVGTLVLESILKRDYPVVLAALIMVATAFVLINLLVDLLYGYLDPRVRTGAQRG